MSAAAAHLENKMNELNAVMIDALLEAGYKLETFGPGIVTQAERVGARMWLTLRCGDLSPAQHLNLRGIRPEDFMSKFPGYSWLPGSRARVPSPYLQEDLEGI